MFPASPTRLFNPLPNNPLHGGNGGSGSSSGGSRMFVDNVLPQQTSSNSILRSPDALPNNHHLRWSDPLCQVKTFMTQTQTTAINTTMADKDINTLIPTPLPMKLIPAFMLVDGWVEQLPGVVPVISCVSGLPQSLPSPSRSNSENITRLNLRPLMLSKGIITSPAAVIPPVQAVPQAQELIPPQPLRYPQPSPLSFCNMTTFPNSQITIQVAQPPVLQNIGLNNRSIGLEHTPPSPPEGECAINSGPGAVPASENHRDAENVAQSAPKQPDLHKQVGHTPHLFTNPRKKIPARRTRFSPYDKGQQRQKAVFGPPKNARFTVTRWKNSLSSLWYQFKHGNYNEKEHRDLMSLLSEMNKNKKSHVTLEWLEETKVTEYLEKFKKEELIFGYEPLVREMAGSILQFWKKEFRIPLS